MEDEKTRILMNLLADPDCSVDGCMDYYCDEFSDTDVMTAKVIEETANDCLKDIDPDQIEQGKRLFKLLDDNPNVRFFDYYNEKPILNKDWLRNRFNLPREASNGSN